MCLREETFKRRCLVSPPNTYSRAGIIPLSVSSEVQFVFYLYPCCEWSVFCFICRNVQETLPSLCKKKHHCMCRYHSPLVFLPVKYFVQCSNSSLFAVNIVGELVLPYCASKGSASFLLVPCILISRLVKMCCS